MCVEMWRAESFFLNVRFNFFSADNVFLVRTENHLKVFTLTEDNRFLY